MDVGTVPGWIWIPIVVVAALAQTLRNVAQRSIARELGTHAATLARFMFGLPLAAVLVWVLVYPGGMSVPKFGLQYAGWIAVAAFAQVLATVFLLLAMQARNLMLAVAFSKTELVQAAVFSSILLAELPGPIGLVAIAVATVGVLLLSIRRQGKAPGWSSTGDLKALIYGCLCGASFALTSVCFRSASLALGDTTNAWTAGAWNVLWSQLLQSLLMGGALAYWRPDTFRSLFLSPGASLAAGSTGALASFGWFTAYGMQNAAAVRTLGLIEVAFSYLIAHLVLKERLSRNEAVGLLLIGVGLVLICLDMP